MSFCNLICLGSLPNQACLFRAAAWRGSAGAAGRQGVLHPLTNSHLEAAHQNLRSTIAHRATGQQNVEKSKACTQVKKGMRIIQLGRKYFWFEVSVEVLLFY